MHNTETTIKIIEFFKSENLPESGKTFKHFNLKIFVTSGVFTVIITERI